jgi:hypothetical protein
MHRAAGQFPKHPTVDRAQAQLAVLGALRSVGGRFEQPAHFGAGEHRVDRQTRLLADERFVARLAQALADRLAAAALPDNGGADGLAAAPVPHNDGLALVADADAGERQIAFLFQAGIDRLPDGRPDLFGVLFDPSAPGEGDRHRRRGARDDLSPLVDEQRLRVGRSLVDGEDGFGHGELPNFNKASDFRLQVRIGLIALTATRKTSARTVFLKPEA